MHPRGLCFTDDVLGCWWARARALLCCPLPSHRAPRPSQPPSPCPVPPPPGPRHSPPRGGAAGAGPGAGAEAGGSPGPPPCLAGRPGRPAAALRSSRGEARLDGRGRGRGRPGRRGAGGARRMAAGAAGSITTLPALPDDGGGGAFPPGHFKDPKRLYCKNGGFFLRINPDGRVDGVREKSDPHSECPGGARAGCLAPGAGGRRCRAGCPAAGKVPFAARRVSGKHSVQACLTM